MSAIERLQSVVGSETVLGLPRSHFEKQLSNFDWAAINPDIPPAIVTFMDDALEGKAPHLIMHGFVGNGKTHIAVGLYRWAVAQVGTLAAMFINGPDFYKRVKSCYGTDYDPLDEVRAATFLVVVDDPFGSKMHPGDYDILFSVIELTYNNNVALVWTMNDDLAYLMEVLADHAGDRVTANAVECVFKGESWR